ncbi:MAG TPA: CU044_5270 family protein [Actinophytocola sp.]|nr:CU044_5270 family protein [Actinophytocola sp.]
MPEGNVREMWSDEQLDAALAALRSDVDTDERSIGRARTELLVAAGVPVEVPEVTEPPSRRRAWWAAAAATIVIVVASVLVVQTVQFGGNPVAHAAAAKELNMAADRIDATDVPLAPGQYRYIGTHAWWMATIQHDRTYSYLAENLLETWVPAKESQEWLLRRKMTGERKWLEGTEEQARAAGIEMEGGWPEGEWRAPCGDFYAQESGREPECGKDGSWQTPNQVFLAALPRDPDELHDRLRDDTEGRGSSPDQEMLVYTADVLRSGLVPADLRASLYRVLARVPDVEVIERVANLDGRKGIAFGVAGPDTRHDVIIDPGTGQFIGERQITLIDQGAIPAGTVVSFTSVSSEVVDEMGQVPTG